MRTIFNNKKAVPFSNRQNRVQISHHAVKMDHQNRLCSFGNIVFNAFGVQGMGLVYVRKDRQSAGLKDTERRGNERIGRTNYFIPGSNTQSRYCGVEGAGTVGGGDGVLCLVPFRPFFFKLYAHLPGPVVDLAGTQGFHRLLDG